MKQTIIILCILFMATSSFAENAMKVVYFQDFQPFCWQDTNNQVTGIFVDVLTEALNVRMGIPLVYEGYPWARAQKMVEDGEADAFVTVSTPERQTYADASTEPVIVMTATIFVKAGNPKIDEFRTSIKTLADLEGVTVGSYLGNGWAKKNLSHITVDWAPSLEMTLKKLAGGRFDIYIGGPETLWYLKQLGLQDQVLEIKNALDQGIFLLHIGKQSPYVHILPKFDETIRAMQKDGTLETIYEKYR